MQFPIIEGNKRIVGLGKTRTGKSTMFRMLLEMKAAEGWWIIIVDPKKDWMMREGGRVMIPYGTFGDFEGKKDFKGSVLNPIWSDIFIQDAKVIIYEPVGWDEKLDAMVDAALTHKYVIFYFDETRQLATSNKIPLKFDILYTQGAAALCGAWAGSQRPVGIPANMKDQAEIWILFHVSDFEDRSQLGRFIPRNKYMQWYIDHSLPYYYFAYYDDRMSGPVILPPLNIPGLKPERSSNIVQYRGRVGRQNESFG